MAVSMLDAFPDVANSSYVSGLSWQGQKIQVFKGDLSEIRAKLPTFTRVPFAFDLSRYRESLFLSQSEQKGSLFNAYKDVIVRVPPTNQDEPMPVGLVSKNYDLVQHSVAIDWVEEGLKESLFRDKLNDSASVLLISDYGERIQLSIDLGVHFEPSDGFPVNLRFVLRNSVDGSTSLEVGLYWFRLVCSNGAVIDGAKEFRRIHSLHSGDKSVAEFVEQHAPIVTKDIKRVNDQWLKRVSQDTISTWANNDVQKSWGIKSAARLIHICKTGRDCEIDIRPGIPYPQVPASKLPVRPTNQVPGQPYKADNLYHVGQAVSWLAQSSSSVQGQENRLREAFGLIEKLGALS